MAKVPAKWIRNPSDTLAVEQGCTFDVAAGEYACDFIERFCCHSKGKWRGQPLVLLPWQRDLLMRLFGWKRPDGTRRFTSAYLEVAKKNGKTTLWAALGIFLEVADGEGAPEVYLLAVDRDQAEGVFEESARMVLASPDLASRLDVLRSQGRIVDRRNDGVIRLCSAEVEAKDGRNSSASLWDELHRQKSRAMWDVFEYAGASREQPLKAAITTAGEDESGVWHEQREYSEKVNRGEIPDTAHLGVVYRADPEKDDIDDPATWYKANPSLGVTIKLEAFAKDLADAKETPTKLANFLRLRLNIITRAEAKFLPAGAWDACKDSSIAWSDHLFEPCWDGLDLSATTDLTAKVSLFGNAQDGYLVRAWFWLPEEGILAKEKRDRVPYRVWATQGWLTLTPGPVVDYSFVRKAVDDTAAEHDLRAVYLDPYNATQLGTAMQDAGLTVTFIRQGYLSLSPPTKELLRLVLGGKIKHDGNPILAWCLANAVVDVDPAGNLKLSKNKSRLRIDGASALVNAIAAATSDPNAGPSVYESRGIISI